MASPLVILLHGVGGTPADMAPLGERIAAELPDVRIAALPAPHPFDLGPQGYQWFSVDGITEENRPGRIQAALDSFINAVQAAQRQHGAAPGTTTLVGFSQGAIMSLAGCHATWLARHAVAIAGRFAPLPARWDSRTAVSLVHGTMDGTMPADHSRRAASRLGELGAEVHLDLVPRAVHMLSPSMQDAAVEALRLRRRGLASN